MLTGTGFHTLENQVKDWLEANTSTKALIDPRRQLKETELPSYVLMYERTEFELVEHREDPLNQPASLSRAIHSLSVQCYTGRKADSAELQMMVENISDLPRKLTNDNREQQWFWDGLEKVEFEGENQDSHRTIKLQLRCREITR